MTKKRIWLLSIFICILTIMLIVVQVVWIENTRESRKRDFEASVSIALARVVDAITHEETYTHVISKLPEALQTSSNLPDSYSERQTSREGIKYTTRSQGRIPYSKLDSFNQGKEVPYMNDSSIIELLKEDGNTLSGNDSDIIKLNSKSIIVEQIVEHIFKIDLPIEQRVTIEQVDTLIRNELKKQSIITDFEVAIVGKDGTISVCTPQFYTLLKHNTGTYKKQLFPNSPNSVEKYYLELYFPEEDFYILQSLCTLIIVSFILTFFILLTFITNLLIITKQKKTSEVRNAFVSNITHEFKTPIATISLAAQMLQDENIPISAKNVPHLSKMVSNQSKKLTFLVEQVLQMSIFDKGDYELKIKPLNVHDSIRKVLGNFSSQIHDMNADVMCKLDATNPIINADITHYMNMISHLFDNALKYSKGVPTVKIATMNKDNGILVSFSDNGIGISKEYQKRIYDQFFRVPSGNVHNVKGFGLGLSYVKKIVEIMGGQVWFHSELDKGSVFFLWMPVKNKTNNI